VEGQDGGHSSPAACGDGRPLSPAWPAPHLTDRSVLGEAPPVSSDPRRLRGVFLTARNPFFLDKIKGTMIKEKPPQNTGFSPTPSKIVNGNVSFLKIWGVHHLPEVFLKAPPVPKIILAAILGIYWYLEESDKSIQYFEVCRKNKYKFLDLYQWLADNYRAKGFYDKANAVLEYCIENISDSARTHLNMARDYLAQAKLDSAFAEVDKAITRDPTFPCNSSYNARVLM
jgi:tetratricopeptide (TPR) repeat protein